MPPPRFMTSSPKILAAMTAIRMIWQSKFMMLGVACEIFALIAATWNWVDSYRWLPNFALTLATIGAFIVACRVAWDYHGRGLNEKQRDDVDGTLTNASLNETQMGKIAEAIQSSGLTPRQKYDLPASIQAIDVAKIVEAQKAVDAALVYLQRTDHGHVVVIYRIGGRRLDVRYVNPPRPVGPCKRQHPNEQGADLNDAEVATSLFRQFTNPAVLWKHPANGNFCHTNYDEKGAPGNELMFSSEDCVPKCRVPAAGDYVLKHNPTGRSTWEQKPPEQP